MVLSQNTGLFLIYAFSKNISIRQPQYAEALLKEIRRLLVLGVKILRVHHNRDEDMTVHLRRRDQAGPRLSRVAGFHARDVGIRGSYGYLYVFNRRGLWYLKTSVASKT